MKIEKYSEKRSYKDFRKYYDFFRFKFGGKFLRVIDKYEFITIYNYFKDFDFNNTYS